MSDNNIIPEILQEFHGMKQTLQNEVFVFFDKLREKLRVDTGTESESSAKGGNYGLTTPLYDTSSAQFFEAHDWNSWNYFFVKKIELTNGTDVPPRAIRDMHILSCLKHPNIIRLERVRYEYKYIFLVMEELDYHLDNQLANNAPECLGKTKDVLTGILRGIEYCHSNGIIHWDLKPENVFITFANEEGVMDKIKLANFGSAIVVTDSYDPNVKTSEYTAPEILMGCEEYSKSIDMWSFGCIFAKMLHQDNKDLFEGESNADVLSKIFSIMGFPSEKSWPEVSEFLPGGAEESSPQDLSEVFPLADDAALDLLKRCLSINPTTRILAAEAIMHPYFN